MPAPSSFGPGPALRAALAGAVDYAGLFPPAKLGMATAVRNHASYRLGAHQAAVGRFVVPVARLPEFEEAYAGLHCTEQSGWGLSALGTSDPAADGPPIAAFNARHAAARIVSFEIKPESAGHVARLSALPAELEVWLEVPAEGEMTPILQEAARLGFGAKLRMGGITPEGFPAPDRVIQFYRECLRLGLRAKATAGLHHALAGIYPLTYEPGSATGPMYGFLNLILTAALLQDGAADAEAIELLRDGDATHFRCSPDALEWKKRPVSTAQLERVRRTLVRAFGSCSFTEPIEGLQDLGWL